MLERQNAPTYLDVVVAVVVNVEDPVQLGVLVDVELGVALGALAQGLTGVLLHLDVVEFSATKKEETHFLIARQ
jgi:hypothetical protein